MGEHDPISDLEQRVAKMRALGVTKWGDIELGPVPQTEAQTTTQQPKKTAAELELEQRVARRTVALAASGSLVRRLAEGNE